MREEEPLESAVSEFDKESPPHVRGRAFTDFRLTDSSGITPACAGKRKGRCYAYPC